LAHVICNPSLPQCHLGYYEHRPDKQSRYLLICLNSIHIVIYNQWLKRNRSPLKSIIHLQQYNSHLHKMNPISHGMHMLCTVIDNFVENYSFILQDRVQPFHWNNAHYNSHFCDLFQGCGQL
jgi:hypothetical protein